ncbi:MAG: sigma-54-dependent Fis family transcriptional regulator [Deltaproteobacteria bacterium]|nr:sigma-54-dependent Fis family transcriptional regulator [Deltaproteobacteria bacterium]
MSDPTETRPSRRRGADSSLVDPESLALLIVWSAQEPARVGQAALPAPGRTIVGRGDDASREHLLFGPLRPGPALAASPLRSGAISRKQLVVESRGDTLKVKRTGKLEMSVNGRVVEEATVRAGDLVALEDEIVFLCTTRSPAAMRGGQSPPFGFGEPDPLGIVGEGPVTWRVRDAIAFAARREGHVLVVGPSGAGKELAARGIHALSRRAGPFVARNAATVPSGLVDAELFGNARNFPNPGMRERAGLFGEADGGTLFLDEIGELPESLQAHLLRVLDDGEYHRLGEDRARRTTARVVAATNRPAASLKHDLLARFANTVEMPGLDARIDDIPVIARAKLAALAQRDAELRARFFEDGEARLESALVCALVTHRFTAHARELENLLMLAMSTSRGAVLELTPEVRARLQPVARSEELTREAIEAALARTSGNASRAWQLLGLSSRDALKRAMKKHGIRARKGDPDDDDA